MLHSLLDEDSLVGSAEKQTSGRAATLLTDQVMFKSRKVSIHLKFLQLSAITIMGRQDLGLFRLKYPYLSSDVSRRLLVI